MKQTILKQTKQHTIARVELLLNSVITDSVGSHWIRSIILDTDDEHLLQLIADSVLAVNKQPFLYLFADNKLLRKYYSLLVKARFYRVKIDLVKYALHKRADTNTGERSQILAETYSSEPEITIVPNN